MDNTEVILSKLSKIDNIKNLKTILSRTFLVMTESNEKNIIKMINDKINMTQL